MSHRGSPLALTVLALLSYKPLRPYGIQRLLKQWGKDLVINVGQRSRLYRVIDRLRPDGLVTVRETERDQAYPERTVYEITEAGRAAPMGGCWRCSRYRNRSFRSSRRRCPIC